MGGDHALQPPILAELFPLFSSRLIRNRATLGGNLGTASPIGDSPPVLLALGAEVVAPQDIYTTDCDVFAPCALGAILNDRTIPLLKCGIVAGAANNQLAEERHGEDLLERGIIYAPDFVINAGGIINVSVEFLEGGYDEDVSMKRVRNIHQAIKDIIATGKEQGIPTSQAAIVLAEKILADGRRKKEGAGPEF